MDQQLQDLKVEVAAFTATVKEWMTTTTDYRKALCGKLDKVQERLNDLPCAERKAWYSGMNRQVGFMWGIIALLLGALISTAVANASREQKILGDVQQMIKNGK